MPAILGTLYLTMGAILVALPLGIVSAVYLTEYAKQGPLVRVIRVGVNCLAGVPSIVFGLFGLGLFVVFLQFGSCILSGALTISQFRAHFRDSAGGCIGPRAHILPTFG